MYRRPAKAAAVPVRLYTAVAATDLVMVLPITASVCVGFV